MKKVLIVLAAAVAGYAVWIKVQQDREERAIWAEVTDEPNPADAPGVTLPTQPTEG
ncbi:DLW-39 family protein [Georgenia sp. Z1344]|uniref:DLW-39 family protein n=1 Tax=Georgenia sp. Z1344 TaxID=3416706 RepID=UPI003CEE049C